MLPRKTLLYPLIALMEMLPAFTILLGFGISSVSGAPTFLFLLLATLIGVLGARILRRFDLGERRNRLAVMGIALIAMSPALAIRSGLVAIFAGATVLAILYWRGLVIGGEDPDYMEVRRRFGLGFGLFFLGLLIVIGRDTISHRSIWLPLAGLGIAYLVTSLVGMVIASTEKEREAGAGVAIALAVGLQLGVLLLLGFLALQIFAVNLVGNAFHATSAIWNSLGAGIYNCVLLVAKPIDHLISLIRPTHHRTLSQITPHKTGANTALPKGKRPKNTPPVAGGLPVTIAGILVGFAILASLAAIIWRVLPRFSPASSKRRPDEERAWLWSLDSFFRTLMRWLRSQFTRSARGGIHLARRVSRGFRPEYPSDPVRRIYAQLLHRAVRVGLIRNPALTAQELCLLLSNRWPEAEVHFAALTAAYEARRYGDVPAADLIDGVKDHWRMVRRTVRIEASAQA